MPSGQPAISTTLTDVTDALHRIELRRVGRQRNEGDVRWDPEGLGAVPAGTVEDHDGVLVVGNRFGEGVEEGLHGLRADLGEDEAEGGLAVGAGGAEYQRSLIRTHGPKRGVRGS